jgi:hypothetical protein
MRRGRKAVLVRAIAKLPVWAGSFWVNNFKWMNQAELI